MNIQTIYDYSKLATLSYVDLSATESPYDVSSVIEVARLSNAPGNAARLPKTLVSQMFQPGVPGPDNKPIQSDISGQWTLLDPYFKKSDETGHSDPASGFAAMLVSNPTYGKVLAIAGTEPNAPGQAAADLAEADVHQIGFWGIALGQLVSLYNYVQVLRAPQGSTVDQLVLKQRPIPPNGSTKSVALNGIPPDWLWLERGSSATGRGLLENGDRITVTGHSLGGHLAALAVALFPDIFKEAFTYNAPGYDPISSRVNFIFGGRDALLGLFSQYVGAPLSSSDLAGRVHTYESESATPGDDASVVSSSVATGKPFSPEVYVTTETNSHDIGHVMDSLGLQALIARLDPTLNLDSEYKRLGRIIEASAADTSSSYENLLEAMTQLLTGEDVSLNIATANALDGGDFSARSQFYDALIKLQDDPGFKSLSGKLKVSVASDIGPQTARTDFSAFLSLHTLSPVRLTGSDAASQAELVGVLSSAWTDTYAQWIADQALSASDRAAGKCNFSDAWLEDRCKMLGWVLTANRMDKTSVLSGSLAPDTSWQFSDHASGITLNVDPASGIAVNKIHHVTFAGNGGEALSGGVASDHLYGGAGRDTLVAGAGNDLLEGLAGNDALQGEDGADSLFGGEGNDYLCGGAGSDQLSGGAGDDLFLVSEGDGWDTIVDAEAGDRLIIAGFLANQKTLQKLADNQWKSTDGKLLFTLFDATENGVSGRTLSIGCAGGGVLVKNFSTGKLGIDFAGANPPVSASVATSASTEGPNVVNALFELSGSLTCANPVLETLGLGGNDALYGANTIDYEDGNGALRLASDVSDHIDGGDGNDWIVGDAARFSPCDSASWNTGGADVLYGGTGDDVIVGGKGEDVLEGGSGNDLLWADGSAGLGPVLLDGTRNELASEFPLQMEFNGVFWSSIGQYFQHGDLSLGYSDGEWAGEKGYLLGSYSFGFGGARNGSGTTASGKTYDYSYTPGAGDSYGTFVIKEDGTQYTYRLAVGDTDALLAFSRFMSADIVPFETDRNTLRGGAGEDGLFGSGGDDVLDGGDGDDELFGNGGNDILFGVDGLDTLVGGAGDDWLDGGAGDDWLVGETGADRLYGGDGNDTLEGDSSSSVLAALGSDDFIDGGLGNDFITGGAGGDTVWGGAGDDSIIGDFNTVELAGIGGNDFLYGGAGQDTILGGIGNDTVDGGDDKDGIDGGKGDDLIMGGAGDDTLNGGEGNDILIGGSGADVLSGGDGADVYVFGSGDLQSITPGSTAIVDGVFDDADDQNVIVFQGGASSNVEVGQAAEGSNDITIIFDGNRGLYVAGGLAGSVNSYEGITDSALSWTDLIGRYYTRSRTLSSSGNNALLVGGAGMDTVVLANDAQNATVIGGRGNDLIQMNAAQGVTLKYNEGDGEDFIYYNASRTTRDAANTLLLGADLPLDLRIHRLADGKFKLALDANDGGIKFQMDPALLATGLGPVDLIVAGDGACLRWADLVARGVTFDTPDSGNIDGSSAADEIYGTSVSRTITTGAGNDTIHSGSGSETIDPGAGNDTMIFSAGFGLDVVLCGSAAAEDSDRIVFDASLSGTTTKFVRVGNNLYVVFPETTDRLTLADYYSAAVAPQIKMPDGSLLDAASIVPDPISVLMTEGNDSLSLSDGPDVVNALGGDDILSGKGGDDTLMGGDGKDTLYGDAGNDYLLGGKGEDILHGGDGDDILDAGESGGGSLYGEAGSNTYVFHREGGHLGVSSDGSPGNGSDRILFDAGISPDDVVLKRSCQRLDVFLTSGTMCMAVGDFFGSVNFENQVQKLCFSDGTVWDEAAIVARLEKVPTTGDDLIRGSGGADFLQGLGGNDTIFGYGGNDHILVGEGRSQVDAGDGDDFVVAWFEEYGSSMDITPGKGHDRVCGGKSELKIHVKKGDGTDEISTNGALREVFFGEGISFSDISAVSTSRLDFGTSTERQYVKINYGDAGDCLVVDVYCNSHDGFYSLMENVPDLIFSDGTRYSWNQLFAGVDRKLVLKTVGTGGDDVIAGFRFRIIGTAGAINNDDYYDAGTGDDQIYDSGGNDFYWFDLGDGRDSIRDSDGSDTIEFGGGISVSDVKRYVSVDRFSGFELSVGSSGDSIYIESGSIENYVFSDGTTFSLDELLTRTPVEYEVKFVDDETIKAVGSYVLPEPYKNLLIDGGSSAIGNDLDNTITALWHCREVFFDGGAGADTMISSSSSDYADTFVVDNPGDVIVGAGYQDTVNASVSYSLPGNAKTLNLTGSDDISGSGNGNDNEIRGNAGNNVIYGGDGSDSLEGGAGSDCLSGGLGNDSYVFNLGDGQDSIDTTDLFGASDSLKFGAEISDSDVLAVRSGSDLLLKIKGTADQVDFIDYYGADIAINGERADHKIDRVEFANGVVWDQAKIESAANLAGSNHSPTVSGYLPTLRAQADSNFCYTVPVDTIIDADIGDSITYSFAMADGSAMPAWLHFDSAARTLAGTPTGGDVGTIQFILNGTDNYNCTIGENVSMIIGSANRAPVLSVAQEDQVATQGAAFHYTVPDTVFTDPDGDVLSYSACLADGSALPAWMSFNSGTRTFSGAPENTGTLSVKVTAKDAGDLMASDIFDVVVRAQNMTLNGTANADTLTGGEGNDRLNGLSGNDKLYGGAGNDVLNGGAGNDSMFGGSGDDIYVVNSARDVVFEALNEGCDLVKSSVTYSLSANVENLTLTGTKEINGTGNALANVLQGNAVANSLSGAAGNDILQGGRGNDCLNGGIGNDTYIFARGDQSDTLTDTDSTVGNLDTLLFEPGVAAEQLWFRKTGSANLEVSIIGTQDKITIKNWSAGTKNQIELFKTSDGRTLSNTNVGKLVAAMAPLTPPAAGRTTLSAAYKKALLTTINANWTLAPRAASCVAPELGGDRRVAGLVDAMASFGASPGGFDFAEVSGSSLSSLPTSDRFFAVQP